MYRPTAQITSNPTVCSPRKWSQYFILRWELRWEFISFNGFLYSLAAVSFLVQSQSKGLMNAHWKCQYTSKEGKNWCWFCKNKKRHYAGFEVSVCCVYKCSVITKDFILVWQNNCFSSRCKGDRWTVSSLRQPVYICGRYWTMSAAVCSIYKYHPYTVILTESSFVGFICIRRNTFFTLFVLP